MEKREKREQFKPPFGSFYSLKSSTLECPFYFCFNLHYRSRKLTDMFQIILSMWDREERLLITSFLCKGWSHRKVMEKKAPGSYISRKTTGGLSIEIPTAIWRE